jgi:hypothetical protein
MRWTLLAAIALLAAGCAPKKKPETVYRMGEPVTVGPLTYTVLETEWRTELGEGVEQKIPKHRFLLLRLSISNASKEAAAAPLLNLEDAEGRPHRELTDVRAAAGWLGLLRLVAPGASLSGTIVFDVPPAEYRLRVASGGDLESERTALIEIPLTLASPAMDLPAVKPPGLE